MFCCLQFCMMSASFAQTKASNRPIAARYTSAKKSMVGVASYYADKFEGRKTASGERYHKQALTAAHPELPFGTLVKVTCLTTRKSVVVRINDRGPFVKGRTLDLSRSAAEKIGLIRKGKAKVKIEVLGKKSAKG